MEDRPGIIAKLAAVLASKHIGIDAVLQIKTENWRDLPFVITVEPATEEAIREAIAEMSSHDYLVDPPLAIPMEKAL